MQQPDMYEAIRADVEESCWLVKVHADDRVEPLQSIGQRDQQGRLVDARYRVGRIDMTTGD